MSFVLYPENFVASLLAMTVGQYRHCEARSNPETQNIKELKKVFVENP